jgi:predicted dehydrogenase
MERNREAMTRREAAVALAGGAVALSGCGGRARARAKDEVRFGLIGAGARGTFLLERLAQVDNGRCVALCDIYEPNLENARQRAAAGTRTYRDYRRLLDDPQIEAVIVATPLFRHFEMTRDALLAGKHVFCEKSLVFRPQEIKELRELKLAHPKQVLQTGLQRRYSPFYRAARQMIEKGILGKVMHIRAQWHRNGAGRRRVQDPRLERQINWRFYREYSGGLAAELASHQFDVADWMFGATPEFVSGVGGIDYWKDGRETYDNIHLIFRYPQGQKLVYTSISYNGHLSLLGGARPNFGEEICGTAGTIHITIGDAANPAVGPAMAMWFREPGRPRASEGKKREENWVAGATISNEREISKGLPILLPQDQISKADHLLEREYKHARMWLYKHDILLPEEERNPVELMLEDFFHCCLTGRRPAAGLEVGLQDSESVILSNLAMDEGRRVFFHEMSSLERAGEA